MYDDHVALDWAEARYVLAMIDRLKDGPFDKATRQDLEVLYIRIVRQLPVDELPEHLRSFSHEFDTGDESDEAPEEPRLRVIEGERGDRDR